MHVDEAVHAIKFGYLLENNFYKYDPVEYHGPTLNYLTLISAYIFGEDNLSEVTETTLRLVPVWVSIILLVMLFLLKDIGKEYILLALILSGFSTHIVFYNRYYIQESLLVSYSYSGIILGYKYLKNQKLNYLVFSAVSFALAYASKETFILMAFSIVVSFFVLRYVNRKSTNILSIKVSSIIMFLGIFVFTSLLFFTSFFTNPEGALDSITTLSNYFIKAGNNADHIQPFYFYFSLISFANINGLFYSEFLIVAFFIFGLLRTFSKANSQKDGIDFLKPIAIITLVLIVVYTSIPYKTPWTMMSYWQGIVLIAAFGIVELKLFIRKIHFYLTVIFISVLLFAMTYFNTIIYSSNRQNPFVYSHTEKDIEIIEPQLTKITAVQNQYLYTPIYIASLKSDYWPLPWYLRKFKNISWNDSITSEVFKYPIILASPELENSLINKLYTIPSAGNVNLYIPLFDEQIHLRPGKEIRGYIRKDYYDDYLNALSK